MSTNSVAAKAPAAAGMKLAIAPVAPVSRSAKESAGPQAIKAIREHYGVFRRGATAGDRINHDGGGAVRQTHAGPDGRVFLRATTDSSDDSEAGDLCVIAQVRPPAAGMISTAGCGARSAVASTPVVGRLAFLNQPDVVAGPAPDGVRSVVLRSSDGSSVEVPVAHNAYVAIVEGDYVGATFVWRDGRRTQH